jgi:hypothetical protein
MRISRVAAAIMVAGSIGLASPALAQMGDHHGPGNGGDHHGGNWNGGNHHGGNWNGGNHHWGNGGHGWHRNCWWAWRHHHRVRRCR